MTDTNQKLREALSELIEAYNRAGPELSRAERAVDRMRLIAAYEALALPTAEQVDDINVAESFTNDTKPQAHWTEHEPVRLAASRVGRVYLAGPMTGIAEFNFPAFNAEAARLRATGLYVLNPADHGIVDGADWSDYLRHDIAGLASCERIHLLRGWSKSKGATLEVTIAKALGMSITFQDDAEQPQAQALAYALDPYKREGTQL